MSKKRIKKPKTFKMGGKNAHFDIVSFQIHNVSIADEKDLPEVESILKTYNSAERCAFKRFKDMGIEGHLLSQRNNGRKSLWRMDKEMGSPIQGTVMALKDWLVKKGYFLDSVLLHNATMSGLKICKSFWKKQTRWQTSKSNPSFGDMESRSRKKITKDEFQLTRNASMTVVGNKRCGNQKFKIDPDNLSFTFAWKRRRIKFNFSSNRFSKKGLKTLNEIVYSMEHGKLPVTMTLTRLEKKGRFNLTLTYSGGEIERHVDSSFSSSKTQSRNIVSGIWVNDEVIHHQIMDRTSGKVLHHRTWKVEDFSGEKRARKYLDSRIAAKDWGKVKKIREKIASRTTSETSIILKKIFSISKGYGAKTMVVEDARHKSNKDFNNSFISFSKNKMMEQASKPCFMTYSRLVKMIQTQCSKFNMELEKVDGTFIQMKSILESHTMMDAIKNACTTMIGRITSEKTKTRNLGLTSLRKWMTNPSMLDWIGHLLHNKRTRQAKFEMKKAFTQRTVEKAVRLIDNRHRLFDIDINDI